MEPSEWYAVALKPFVAAISSVAWACSTDRNEILFRTIVFTGSHLYAVNPSFFVRRRFHVMKRLHLGVEYVPRIKELVGSELLIGVTDHVHFIAVNGDREMPLTIPMTTKPDHQAFVLGPESFFSKVTYGVEVRNGDFLDALPADQEQMQIHAVVNSLIVGSSVISAKVTCEFDDRVQVKPLRRLLKESRNRRGVCRIAYQRGALFVHAGDLEIAIGLHNEASL